MPANEAILPSEPLTSSPSLEMNLAVLRTVGVLLHADALALSEIAARALLSDQSAARIILQLTDVGWVAREADLAGRQDGRFRLTDQGRAAHRRHTAPDPTGTAR